jgi:hypothetical protein
LNILYRFFNMEIDKNGEPLQPQPYRNYFEGGPVKVGEEEKTFASLFKFRRR